MTGKAWNERGPYTRDAARPEPQKSVVRAEPRGTPEHPSERAAQPVRPVRPRGGPPRPRGVR